ncbi:sugar phosphate isomerase/epimerase [Methanonatronarchaeum sp. AMET6-2]|uniref:sugar phosphate isomerase/epimerase family protein n=1 Tax=Methanonatronarchaeum sp. AMET6-2 TaxID=2933293 RepID=UPI001FF4B3F5|nr:sugar phosphate isomerase/epimerase family protein [Methanonatronarchaeum sp. AMET6-2]UOY09544.1 sugar phosphate isomerase/epimerase [Methanonatronarchaeum sp. AMET6-2]
MAIFWQENYDILREIERLAAMDFEAIEVYCEYPFLKRWNEDDYRDEVHEVSDKIDEFGLDVVTHGSHYDINLSTWNDEVRDVAVKQVKKSVDAACIMGSNKIVVHPGYLPSKKFDREKTLNRMVNSLREIGRYAGKHDISVGLENLRSTDKGLCVGPEELKKAIEMIGLSNVGVTFDIAHANSIPHLKPQEYLEYIKDDVVHVHISDNRGDGLHYPIGVGNIDFKPILRGLLDIDYDGQVTLEGWLPKWERKETLVKMSIVFLEDYLEDIRPKEVEYK